MRASIIHLHSSSWNSICHYLSLHIIEQQIVINRHNESDTTSLHDLGWNPPPQCERGTERTTTALVIKSMKKKEAAQGNVKGDWKEPVGSCWRWRLHLLSYVRRLLWPLYIKGPLTVCWPRNMIFSKQAQNLDSDYHSWPGAIQQERL